MSSDDHTRCLRTRNRILIATPFQTCLRFLRFVQILWMVSPDPDRIARWSRTVEKPSAIRGGTIQSGKDTKRRVPSTDRSQRLGGVTPQSESVRSKVCRFHLTKWHNCTVIHFTCSDYGTSLKHQVPLTGKRSKSCSSNQSSL